MRKRDFERLLWINSRNYETIKYNQWPVHMYTNYAPWLHFFYRLVTQETGLEDFPDVEFRFASQNADHMRRIRMVIQKPRRIEIEVLIDRGDEVYAPFFREMHVSAELKTKAPCALWVSDGEWDGVRDVTVRLNESERMRDLLARVFPKKGKPNLAEQPPPGPAVPCPSLAKEGSFAAEAAGPKPRAWIQPEILPLARKVVPPSADELAAQSFKPVGLPREYYPGWPGERFQPPPPVRVPDPFRKVKEPAEIPDIPEWLIRPSLSTPRLTLYDQLRHHKGFLITRKEAENELCFEDWPVQRGRKRKITSKALERLRGVQTKIWIEPRTRMRSWLHAVVRLDDNQLHLGDVLNLVNEAEAVIRWRPPCKPSPRTTLLQRLWNRWSTIPGSRQADWDRLVELYGGDWQANDRAWRRRAWDGTSEPMWQFIESRKDWIIGRFGSWTPPPRRRRDRGMLHWDPRFGGWGKKPVKRLSASMPLSVMIQHVMDRARDPEEEEPWETVPAEEEVWNGPAIGMPEAAEFFWPPGYEPHKGHKAN